MLVRCEAVAAWAAGGGGAAWAAGQGERPDGGVAWVEELDAGVGGI